MSTPSVNGATASGRVLNRSDYLLFLGCFALLAGLVLSLVLLMSFFKQRMALQALSRPDQCTRLEVRQYVGILAQDASVERLDGLRTQDGRMPALFAAMALAGAGEGGAARLRADLDAGTRARRVAAMAGLEYEYPGTLLPRLRSAPLSDRWAEAVQAATVADIYSTVDFIREMDGHFIALFPGKKAIDAEVMSAYQRGLGGLFADADEPAPLAAALAFHADQLRQHPELYKPGVLKKIQESWELYLQRVFQQRQSLRASQDAVRALVEGTTGLPASWLDAANRLLAGRHPANPLAVGVEDAGVPLAPGESLLRRDGASLRALVLSVTGAVGASAGFDHVIRVWPAGDEGSGTRVIRGHRLGVLALAVSPDGASLASAGLDGTIRVWETATGRERLSIPAGTRRVAALAYSPDGARLAAGGASGTIRLLDAASGNETRVLRRHVAEVTALVFTPDGQRLAAGGLDRSLSVWNLADADAKPVVLDRHGDAVWALAADPAGRWLASGAADRRVLLWDLADPTQKPTMLKGHKGTVTALASSHDGSLLASAGADGVVMVWDTARARLAGAHPTGGLVNALCFEPGDRTLLLAGDDGTLRRWTVSREDERPFSFRDWVLWLFGKA